jgi:hypothetical protein
MAKKTQLALYGAPGRTYGSFSGKSQPVGIIDTVSSTRTFALNSQTRTFALTSKTRTVALNSEYRE